VEKFHPGAKIDPDFINEHRLSLGLSPKAEKGRGGGGRSYCSALAKGKSGSFLDNFYCLK